MLVALVLQLPLELADVGLEGFGGGDVCRKGCRVQGAERQCGADLVPGVQHFLGLLENVGWEFTCHAIFLFWSVV